MEVYIFETNYLADSEVTLDVFANESDALSCAAKFAHDRMKDYECNNPDGDYFDSYQDIKDCIAKQQYSKALKVYRDWNCELDFNDQMYVVVYSKEIIGSVQINQDVTCKQCKRNVGKADINCWYCGVLNPGG